MIPPRVLRALCLLLVLVSATPLVTTATADAGKQRHARPPTLLWQAFPLRQRAAHQIVPKPHVEAIARNANGERSVGAVQATKTFPGSVIIGLLAATMLVAATLFIARRPQVLMLGARTRKPPVVGHSADEADENHLISAGARTTDAFVATDDRAQTAADEIDEATRTWAFRQDPDFEPLPNTPHANVQPDGGNGNPEWDAPPKRPGEQRTGIERCEIVLWTGYVKKQFYAAPLGATRMPESLESPYFRLRDANAPNATAAHALDGLIAQLENAGWQVVSRGAHWYQYRLERLP